MTTSLRLCGTVVILMLLQQLVAKALPQDNKVDDQQQRVKRGYSKYGENDFGTPIQVSSGVLQYSTPEEHPTLDASNSYDHSAWTPSSPSSGYDMWLEPSQTYDPSSAHDTSASSSPSVHPGSDHISNGVLSTDSHFSQMELPHSEGLHTQISSSSSSSSGISSLGDGDIDIGHYDAAHISDNIDFDNIADTKSTHYAKSYGK